jgi:predicted alpha/beta-fold hydrolase
MRTLRLIFLLVTLQLTAGCLSERSYPFRKGDFITSPDQVDRQGPQDTRSWLRRTHRTLRQANPRRSPPALITEELRKPDGSPVDVMAHFDVNPRTLQTLLFNYFGLTQTAQLVGQGYAAGPEQVWPGFEEVWIPVAPNVSLAGWMAYARKNGHVIDANCIVLIPGLLGCNQVRRTRDLGDALVAAGHHVLALELRGHGQTDVKYPDVYYTYGVMETADLLKVSEWLDDRPHVRASGLIGFCWGANDALLAAWFDGRSTDDASISSDLRKVLGPRSPRRHFTAGIMAFSGAWRSEDICDELEKPCARLNEPVSNAVQELVMGRAAQKKLPHQQGSLRSLIVDEFSRSELNSLDVADAYLFVRFLPYRDQPAPDKLSCIRVPTLIISAANDPMTGGQPVADLICRTDNPNVAAIVTAGGGHNGFAAWSRRYYFSLILNFFDMQTGPAAVPQAVVKSPDGSVARQAGLRNP